MLLLVNNLHGKTYHKKSRKTKFWQDAHTICYLYLCYNSTITFKVHSFSGNQTHIIFFMYIIRFEITISPSK